MSTPGQLNQERLLQLRNQYLSLVQLEVEEFGVKPTEVRHLIGRLGEFECALLVGGTLSHIANQHGFDVVAANGRKISVKATGQKSGFVAISKSTLHHADDLMVIQYKNARLEVLYYGCINKKLPKPHAFMHHPAHTSLSFQKPVSCSTPPNIAFNPTAPPPAGPRVNFGVATARN